VNGPFWIFFWEATWINWILGFVNELAGDINTHRTRSAFKCFTPPSPRKTPI
jgi:hypothetical protein